MILSLDFSSLKDILQYQASICETVVPSLWVFFRDVIASLFFLSSDKMFGHDFYLPYENMTTKEAFLFC